VPSPPAPRAETPLESTGVDGTCVTVDGAGAGAGGADCAQAPAQPELSVDAPVDLSPAGVDVPTVATDRVPCHRVPDTAFTQCTEPGEDR
jgi:hypothetical protein